MITNKEPVTTYRISVLTDCLLRLEYQEAGRFMEDRTQIVENRVFPGVHYEVRRAAGEDGRGRLIVETDGLLLTYDEKEFSAEGLSILVKSTGNVWHYGDHPSNLGGTARTLDTADGAIPLEDGLFSREGYAVLDDSKSAFIRLSDGQICPRTEAETDLYFFGYGTDYQRGLKDFYHLTGPVPMIPRYALGNWWSRFHRYTEEEYLRLVEDFAKEQVPISVAVIDMDWHITDPDPKYGSGWTGYTWNRELFPDPERFLQALHDRHLATTLNVHPADGIRAFEEMYPQMAEAVGIDPHSEDPVEFDMTDPSFRAAYFTYVNHYYEKMGVDFWWVDWQQGTKSRMEGIDPLWLLNHYYYQDQADRKKRPMIFSRYAGPGSHRYPIGFSGDTCATWKSLEFQPYFTMTASNIGYGWWSHDICGHMHGRKNDEMMIRWLQLGVFSPIMRLHSTSNPFFIKEPWNQSPEMRRIMDRFMRLRHRMIPYTYTMNYRAYAEGIPLIQPMYYEHPENEDAYEVRAEYAFGSELIVGAITEETDPALQMAGVDMVLPEGRYYDLLNARIYRGGKRRKLYRTVEEIPVLLKAGGILVLGGQEYKEAGGAFDGSGERKAGGASDGSGEPEEGTAPDRSGDRKAGYALNDSGNPEVLEIYYGAGADGCFELYEDDGCTMEYLRESGRCITRIEIKQDPEKREIHVRVNPAYGNSAVLPKTRRVRVHVLGVKGKAGEERKAGEEVLISSEEFLPTRGWSGVITDAEPVRNDVRKLAFELLDRAWIEYDLKDTLYRGICEALEAAGDDREALRECIRKLQKEQDLAENLADALLELTEDA
jgi:hypothetical protein